MALSPKPIGIYFEHPEWFKPLFAELDRRGLGYEKIDAARHLFNPAETESRYSLVVNRMSSSAFLRGHGQGIFHTAGYTTHLERLGTRVINGSAATAIETNKARQLSLFESLGLKYPKTFVINHTSRAVDAARELRFPIVVKVNIGGSGAGIVRFDTLAGLQSAVAGNRLDLGLDQTALVQEYVTPRGGHIHRVEALNGKFLYGIKVFTSGESFNLCPAEICRVPEEESGNFCLTEAAKNGIQVEAFTPPPAVIAAVERIVAAAKIDVGGVEYLIDDHTGDVLFYDVNALSNFVTNAVSVVGFDPHARLVDFLESQLPGASAAPADTR